MKTLNGQWIELFRAGDYGDKGSYGEADIDKMIAQYDPGKHEAPVVIGHPEHNAPAYGWVEALKRVGKVLMGKLAQVQPEFEELVRKGLFKKRSISFYTTPQGPALRHVGFLGAMPPEVKGLADVKLASFSAGAFQAIEFTEEDTNVDVEQVTKGVTQSLKEFFSELFKGKKVIELNDADEAKKIETAVAAALKPLQAKFTELENAHSKLQKEFADTSSTDADGDKNCPTCGQPMPKKKSQMAEQQIARLKGKPGVWIPAFDKMGLPAIFSALASSAQSIEFGEGDKKIKKSAAEAFADFMLGLNKIVPMGEIAAVTERHTGKLVQFTEPNNGTAVDEQSVAMAEAAKQLMHKEKISYGEALKRVRESGEFVSAGAAAVNQV
jgi:hypothetical protein